MIQTRRAVRRRRPPQTCKFGLSSVALPLALLCALGGTGCSGDDDPPAADACSAEQRAVEPITLIDDLEDGNGAIAVVGERNGSWWVATDGTPEGSVTPPAEQAPSPERILGGRCGSSLAMRLTGQGFTSWGAVLVAGFRYVDAPAPIDAGAFRGVEFWARVGEQHTSPVRVQFQDGDTTPEGGVCNPEPGSSDECYNGFGSAVLPIDGNWRSYRYEFGDLSQRDYGYRAEAFDATTLYSIEWTLEQDSVFDLWVDDVWFYR